LDYDYQETQGYRRDHDILRFINKSGTCPFLSLKPRRRSPAFSDFHSIHGGVASDCEKATIAIIKGEITVTGQNLVTKI
jgi:hypothetical protein